jgi:hypothetical protein
MAVLSSAPYVAFTSNLPLYTSSTMQALFQPRTSIIVTLPKDIKSSSLTAQEIVSWFRSEGLPIAAIADIARVERKSVYAWVNGGLIRQPNQERLEKLYSLLTDKKQTELIHLYRFWNRKLMSGTSLSILLCEERLNAPAIKAAVSELWPMALRAKKSLMIHDHKNSGKSNPFLDEISEVFISDDL